MKKFFSTLLTAVLLVSLIVGCAPKREAEQGGGENEKPEKLVVWENDDGIQLNQTKKLAKEYEKKTGIKVEVIGVNLLKQEEKLVLDGPVGKGADLVTWPHDHLGSAVTKGLIQPIGVDSTGTDSFEKYAIDALTYDGKLYGLPKVSESVALIYNKKLMPQPPDTYEELVEYAKANTRAAEKKYGVLFEANNLYYTYFLFAGNGGYIFKNNTNPQDMGLQNEGAIAGMKEVETWFKEGLVPQGLKGDTVNGLFKEGKVGAVINGPWAVRDYQSAKIDVGVAPLPKYNGKEAVTLIGVKGWYLSAYSKYPKYATDLMKFLTSKEALKSRFQETGEIPPHKELIEDPIIKDDPLVNGFAQQAKSGIPMPSIPEMGAVWEPINNAHDFVAAGKQTPEKALTDAVKLIQEKLKAMKQ